MVSCFHALSLGQDETENGEKRRQRCVGLVNKIRQSILTNWLPFCFAIAIIWALAWPLPGKTLISITILGDVHVIQEACMVVVFFISGLTLDTKDLARAKGHWAGVAYGFLAISAITPLLGMALGQVPLQPRLLSIGLLVYTLAPTTLGVGVALVRSCKGNEGVALLLTVGTNMLAVAIMPPYLRALTSVCDTADLGLNTGVNVLPLFLRLGITMTVPTVLGKAVRELIPPAARFARTYKAGLGQISTACLAAIVWQTLSSARPVLFETSGGNVGAVIALGAFTYVFYLGFNTAVVRLCFPRLPAPEAVAVVVMASQKSAPVAVTLISYITSSPSDQGIMAVPCIVGQLTQVALASAMAPPIAKWVEACAKRDAAAAAAANDAQGQAQGHDAARAAEEGQAAPERAAQPGKKQQEEQDQLQAAVAEEVPAPQQQQQQQQEEAQQLPPSALPCPGPGRGS